MASCSCVNVWKDPNICGDSLVVPMRASCRAIARIFTKNFECIGLGKLFELASRIVALAIVLTLLVISLPFALIGMTIKFPCSLCTEQVPLPSPPGSPKAPPTVPPTVPAPFGSNPLIPPSVPNPLTTPNPNVFYKAPAPTGKGAQENTFFDLEDVYGDAPFVNGIAHLCTTPAQMDYAIYVCMYVLSLVRHPHEEGMARNVLTLYPFDQLPKQAGADIDKILVNLCVQTVGVFLGKHFNTSPKEVFEELAVRFDTYFHGTSITAVDSIKENGLSRAKRCMNDQHEIAQIKASVGDIFGYYTGQPQQSFYVAEGVSTAWLFAKRSPEWFASVFERIKQPTYGYRESPFYADKRNKVQAMQELEAGLKARGHSVEKIQKVKGFCEKFWQLYTGPYGAVVVARRNRPRHVAIADWLTTPNSSFSTQPTTAEEYLNCLYKRMSKKTVENSLGIAITTFDFAPQDLTIFRIPFHSMDSKGRVRILSHIVD